ncbi:hypothetical protein BDQ17DRAFT_1470190 [Cyathus striatus]|nr:hypothetical protein BDQ17DRAFT_1470190 [Cyathus striatus]
MYESMEYIPKRVLTIGFPSLHTTMGTLPDSVMQDIVNILQLPPEDTECILRSNDHPKIWLKVKTMEYPANGFQDLAFLILDGFENGDQPPSKFVVFFDNTKESECTAKFLQG